MRLVRVQRRLGLRAGTALLFPFVAFLLLAPNALAKDLDAQRGEAQANAAEARSDLASLEPRLAAAKEELRPIAAASAKADDRAAQALKKARSIETDLIEQRKGAAKEIDAAQARYHDEVADDDRDVQDAIGFGLGLLVLAGIVLAWSLFRGIAPVQWLTERGLMQALGICLGAGLVVVLIGGALLGSSGVARVAGGFLITVGLGLPVALLLARHSLRVERGSETPLVARERLPGCGLDPIPALTPQAA